MTTDNRTNEPTDGALLSALIAWSRAEHEQEGIKRPFEPAGSLDDYNNSWIRRMRAALMAAADATPQAESALDTTPVLSAEKVIDALVMTDLSDYAGTDMGMIRAAAQAVLAALGGESRVDD